MSLAKMSALLVLVVSGCGPAALPGPTAKPVAEADLLGRWSYIRYQSEPPITIEFRPDRTFQQTVTPKSGQPMVQQGTWSLDGPHVHLEQVLMNMSGDAWTPHHGSWWFVDAAGRLELYGGTHPDPDACWPLKFLGPLP